MSGRTKLESARVESANCTQIQTRIRAKNGSRTGSMLQWSLKSHLAESVWLAPCRSSAIAPDLKPLCSSALGASA